MKNSLIMTAVVCAMLVATGFAANEPAPDQRQYVGIPTQDLHFQQYEEIRPFLILEQGALTALCDDEKAGLAPRVQVGTTDWRELPGYAY